MKSFRVLCADTRNQLEPSQFAFIKLSHTQWVVGYIAGHVSRVAVPILLYYILHSPHNNVVLCDTIMSFTVNKSQK